MAARDPEAAFPTAQWTAGMRAADAGGAMGGVPLIGGNLTPRVGPDLAAEIFAGAKGIAMEAETRAAAGGVMRSGAGLIVRTLRYDAAWMRACERGVRQFVVLGAGLDSRAWRLPAAAPAAGSDGAGDGGGSDGGHTVFEVDVPRAHAYKRTLVPQVDAVYPSPAYRRVEVEADLADAEAWPAALRAAGFDAAAPAFFVAEGLLMYLPSRDAVVRLLRTVHDLMAPGGVSEVHGDTFVDVLRHMKSTHPTVQLLRKYGASAGFEFDETADVTAALAEAGLRDASLFEISPRSKALLAEAAKSWASTGGGDGAETGVETRRRALLEAAGAIGGDGDAGPAGAEGSSGAGAGDSHGAAAGDRMRDAEATKVDFGVRGYVAFVATKA